ncbi:MAG: hypothetical protein K2X72_19135 [Reyranella sp.]|nr:hypothetical protein [Reyranella sp.]
MSDRRANAHLSRRRERRLPRPACGRTRRPTRAATFASRQMVPGKATVTDIGSLSRDLPAKHLILVNAVAEDQHSVGAGGAEGGNMTSPMSVFLTEGNVEIYLSRLHTTWSLEERDRLLRLLVQEESRMGTSREHLENGERRVSDGRDRIIRQRRLVADIPPPERAAAPASLLLETLEKTQALLEEHLVMLQRQRESKKL